MADAGSEDVLQCPQQHIKMACLEVKSGPYFKDKCAACGSEADSEANWGNDWWKCWRCTYMLCGACTKRKPMVTLKSADLLRPEWFTSQ